MNALKNNSHEIHFMETIIVLLISGTLGVSIASPFIIRWSADKPANGEVRKLTSVHSRTISNVQQFNIISKQPKNQLHGNR
jgi:hypothetical protein